VLEPHPASIQDRDGGGPLLRVSGRIFPFIQRVFADSGYAGEKVTTATLIAVEIVRKNPDQIGFAVNPRRWVVERFFAWIGRNRRLAKDFEGTIDSACAFLYAASVILLWQSSRQAMSRIMPGSYYRRLNPHSPDDALSNGALHADSDMGISTLFWIERGGDGKPGG